MKKLLVPIILLMFAFTTVNAYQTYELSAANFLAEKGIINNNSTKSEDYNLDQNVLRQEIAAVARGVAGIEKTTGCIGAFIDVSSMIPNDWACFSIEALARANLIASNELFRPEENITKAEGLGMLVKAACGGDYRFDSSKSASWQEQVVVYAAGKSIVGNFTDYDSTATRGWVFEAGARAMVGCEENTVENTVEDIVDSATATIADDITITIYDDARCTDCQIDAIISSLKQLPVLSAAEFIVKDFSEPGVEEFILENIENINLLPAAIFSTNAVGPTLGENLRKLSDGSYFLRLADGNQVPGFDPFEERSANGFQIVDRTALTQIQENAYYKGPEDAIITWIEYTDVNCGFCKKMELDGTAITVMAEFPTELNKTSSNYIGVGGAATQNAAQILECAGSLGGGNVYNAMISETLTSGDNSVATLLVLGEESGIDPVALQSCYDNGDSRDIVDEKFAMGTETFGITGTPGNVLVNNTTGEYTIVSGAYPSTEFITQINNLLGR